MDIKIIHNPNEVYEFLKTQTRFNYIYQFNNLALEFWSNVICYGLYDHKELKQIAMLNINEKIPVLLAACFDNYAANIELVKRVKVFLPSKFYTHIDRVTLENVFSASEIYDLEDYMNMGITPEKPLAHTEPTEAIRLSIEDLPVIKELLAVSYPEAWLDDEMVKPGKNFGIIINDQLISFAGIHAYSELYQVAAVAHVTTHPIYRRQGYSKKVLLSLLNELRKSIKYIGLNVKIDNLPAINCYQNLGFKEFGKFVACIVEQC